MDEEERVRATAKGNTSNSQKNHLMIQYANPNSYNSNKIDKVMNKTVISF